MNFFDYLLANWEMLLELSIEHAQVVLLSLAIAAVIGVSLGVLVYRRDRLSQIVLAIASTMLTIPSFALFGILIIFLGLGWTPTVVALTNYALLPILRNTITGLRSVDPAITESAMGMGYSATQRLVRIELPLAWPVIITGLRVSALLILGIAAIAAYVNGPGLGELIFQGLARIGGAGATNQAALGTLGVVLLALLFEVFFSVLNRLTTSRGI
jgi:osmoprotectant transport system permease protein